MVACYITEKQLIQTRERDKRTVLLGRKNYHQFHMVTAMLHMYSCRINYIHIYTYVRTYVHTYCTSNLSIYATMSLHPFPRVLKYYMYVYTRSMHVKVQYMYG